MKERKVKKTNFWRILAFVMIVSLFLSACGPSTSSAKCAFIVGNGTYDRDIKEMLLPGQAPSQTWNDAVTQFYPCNSRNYLVTNGAQSDVAGQLGDRPWPIEMTTPSGTAILVEATAFWTPSQDPETMRALYTVFDKYDATSLTESSEGNVNASTPGWNKMLSENFGPTMDAIALTAARNIRVNPPMSADGTHQIIFDDNSWKIKDTEQWEALANEMSSLFARDVSKRLGFSDLDLFCGSGQSRWMDPEHPERIVAVGEGTYYCAPVRIEVNNIIRDPNQGDTGSQGLIEANQQRYEAAKELYGDQTSCWLGILDAIEACKGSSTPCTFIIDGNACTVPDGSAQDMLVLPNFPEVTPVEPTATTAP